MKFETIKNTFKKINFRSLIRLPLTLLKKLDFQKFKQFFYKYKFWIISSLAVVVIAIGIILTCTMCSNSADVSDFYGKYYIDDYTAYEFDGNGKGALCLGETTKYPFDYTVKDDTVLFDFENEKAKDATYTFIIDDNEITLSEVNSEASYNMTKK